MSDPNTLKHSPLEAAHIACGARMVEFGGWSMPVQYSGIIDEHKAVRSASGMFDISHMGEVTVSGPGALAWLESLLTNRVGKLALTRGQYSLMLDERGGVIDDLILYRSGEQEYFLVINAACRDIDLAWMRGRLPADGSVVLNDLGDAYAAIALQGPDSERILRALAPGCEVPKRNGIASLPGFTGRPVLEAQRAKGLPSQLTPLKLTVQGPPLRSHYSVLSEGSVVGETCSGALSPSLGEGIAMAYLPVVLSTPGTLLEIEVRGRRYAAIVATLPFYKKPAA